MQPSHEASPRLGIYWHCRRDARTGAANSGRLAGRPSRPGWEVESVIPSSAKREQRFFAEGGRKPKVIGGSRSRTTEAEGTDLHKRGTSAEGWEGPRTVACSGP